MLAGVAGGRAEVHVKAFGEQGLPHRRALFEVGHDHGDDRRLRRFGAEGEAELLEAATETPQSAIIAVIMPDLEKGAAMWEALLAEGLYVNLARPPATPANMTLLRCSLCAEHSDEEVGRILTMFENAGKAVGVI